MMFPAGFIESHGPSLAEEQQTTIDAYRELKDEVYSTLSVEFGVALLISYAYVIYHLISKFRGNEKNAHMNNFGVVLALLLFLYYSVYFTDDIMYTLA